jgi:hypothetical protein
MVLSKQVECGLKNYLLFLMNLRYRKSNHDNSLFIKCSGNLFCVVLMYVDDLILCGNNIDEINALKLLLDKKNCIKDLGQFRYFLGLEIARSKKGIFLN